MPRQSPYAPFSPEWNNENVGAPLRRVSIAFIVLQTFFVCLFLVTRYTNRKTLWNADVWFILLGFAWNITCIATILVMVHLGLGRHMLILVATNWPRVVFGLKLLFIQQFAYLFAAAFPKLAILYLYHQLFVSRVYRMLTYATGVVVVLGLIALCLANFLICRPLAYNWDKLLPGGSCGDLGLLFQLVSLPNLMTDIAILILPMPMIWKLQMRTSQKVGLTATFLTGSFGMVTAILRLYYFSTGDIFADLTYNGPSTGIWTAVEPSCYLIAAILPSLRPLLKTVHDSRLYSLLKSRSNSMISRPGSQRDITSIDATQKGNADGNQQANIEQYNFQGEKVTREYFV